MTDHSALPSTPERSPDIFRQSVDLLRYYLAQQDVLVSAERLKSLSLSSAQTTEELAQAVAHIGRDLGLKLRFAVLTEDDFRSVRPSSFSLFFSDTIEVVVRVHSGGQRAILRNISEGTSREVTVSTLFQDKRYVEALVYEGTIHSFLSDKTEIVRAVSGEQEEHLHVNRGHILRALWRLLRQEKKDISIVLGYSVVLGLLSLIIPLSSQAIVNAITLGVYTVQLVFLCALVGVGMLLQGGVSLLEGYVVDVLERRIFVRTAYDIAWRLPRFAHNSGDGEYLPELLNRYFDTFTVQKVIGKFLVDGISTLLVAAVGLLLLAVYHPLFIIFDILLILFLSFIIFVLSRGGLESSIKESKKKYLMAQWLEEVARCLTSFKLLGSEAYIFDRVDTIASQYVSARAKHFKVLVRQMAGSWVFSALTTVGVLAIGGVLVLDEQLSIGQLVAAELVVISLMASFNKLVNQFEEFYDLMTAIDKLLHITERPLENHPGVETGLLNCGTPVALRLENVHYSIEGRTVLNGVSFEINAAENVSIVGENGSGKSTLISLLTGLDEPSSGSILLNGIDIRRLRVDELRSLVSAVIDKNEIFDGTLEDNILMGRTATEEELADALKLTLLYDYVNELPKGLLTHVSAGGSNLSSGMIRRIKFARAVLKKPMLLILDNAFLGMDERTKIALQRNLYSRMNWTVVNIHHAAEHFDRADRVIVLRQGVVMAEGSIDELIDTDNKEFTDLFPVYTSLRRNGFN